MTRQEKMLAKKLGRPATGKGHTVGVRLQPPDLTALDAYQAAAGSKSRPEAIRAILTEWLRERGYLPK